MTVPEFNEYWLRRWSLLVRIRDDYTCMVCGKRFKSGLNAVQAHHVKPKGEYPEEAYDLSNGITVCAIHHQPMVHTTDCSWKNWVPMFRRFNSLVLARDFNSKNQEKIHRVK